MGFNFFSPQSFFISFLGKNLSDFFVHFRIFVLIVFQECCTSLRKVIRLLLKVKLTNWPKFIHFSWQITFEHAKPEANASRYSIRIPSRWETTGEHFKYSKFKYSNTSYAKKSTGTYFFWFFLIFRCTPNPTSYTKNLGLGLGQYRERGASTFFE